VLQKIREENEKEEKAFNKALDFMPYVMDDNDDEEPKQPLNIATHEPEDEESKELSKAGTPWVIDLDDARIVKNQMREYSSRLSPKSPSAAGTKTDDNDDIEPAIPESYVNSIA